MSLQSICSACRHWYYVADGGGHWDISDTVTISLCAACYRGVVEMVAAGTQELDEDDYDDA